eukprot:SAG11_NODE_134_length_15338_cov_3.876435_15_plen_46_part_00
MFSICLVHMYLKVHGTTRTFEKVLPNAQTINPSTVDIIAFYQNRS